MKRAQLNQLAIAISLTGYEHIDFECLSTVANQSRRTFEVICVGPDLSAYREIAEMVELPDPSEEITLPRGYSNLAEIFQMLAVRDIPISFIDCDGSLDKQRAIALAEADSEAIIFMDNALILQPRAVAYALTKLQNFECDIVRFHSRRFDYAVGKYVSIRLSGMARAEVDSLPSFVPSVRSGTLFTDMDSRLDDKIFKVDLLRSVEGGFRAKGAMEPEPFVLQALAKANKVASMNIALTERAFDSNDFADLAEADWNDRISPLIALAGSPEMGEGGEFQQAYRRWLAHTCAEAVESASPEARRGVIENIRKRVIPLLGLSDAEPGYYADDEALEVMTTIAEHPAAEFDACMRARDERLAAELERMEREMMERRRGQATS